MQSKLSALEVIENLNLAPLPGEGGYFRETYRCTMPTVPARSFGLKSETERNASTAIYFLITPESFSALHRIKCDEVYHFYAGDPAEMIQIDESGELTRITLGSRIELGEVPQVVARSGVWQASRVKEGGQWTLLGATVAPSFEFEDFEFADRDSFSARYQEYRNEIARFTREAIEGTSE